MSNKPTITQLKRQLRQKIKLKLSKIPLEQLHQQSLQIQHLITSSSSNESHKFPEFQKAKTVGLYMNMPQGELPTGPLIQSCFQMNKTVYLPRITKLGKFGHEELPRFQEQKSILRFLKVDDLNEVENLIPRGKFKIREPDFKYTNDADQKGNGSKSESRDVVVINDLLSERIKLDLLFVPGVAFDSNCYRMGHGAGFYDDFIKRYVEVHGEKPFLVGVGLKEQLVSGEDDEVLHTEEHDEKLDCVIVGDRIYRST
ncbi:unnamed protein product [Ambrosiozyma monospora]|uniref:Unnamed protein product n=1 Tax=Ambrosiozyma monospora TaxID=43982 RepID=A0ACB5TKJ1_AMBMO|nr:unnamed protein product [Ambrosiozyma monospora]